MLLLAAAPYDPAPAPRPIEAMLLQGTRSPLGIFHIDLGAASRFYALRGWAPAWTATGEEETARLALATLSHAAAEGLNPEDYHLADLERLARLPQAAAKTEYDILLSASLLHYETDARAGRLPPDQVDDDVALQGDLFDAPRETQMALAQGRLEQFLRELPPPHPEYQRLRRALENYRRIEAEGGWPIVPDTGTVDLHSGDARIPALRARLAAERFLADPAAEDPANAQLEEALRRYQHENGLAPDGRAGKKTLASLNVPVAERISQIVANMERWRWVRRQFGSHYIEVNAADASLTAVENGAVVITSRVIVGKPSNRTPIFEAVATAITVNPFWKVPAPIARREILPKAWKDSGYLAANGMFIDSQGQVRQSPGPRNALGLLKLELPNRFNTYLHDTPARMLFARDLRFLSHGCIRVEQIRPLASFAMTGDPSAGLAALDAHIAGGTTRTIPLENPLPVYVDYWTAIGDEDGRAGFRPDIYGRDRRLLAALAGRHPFGRMAANTHTDCGAARG